MDDDMEITDAEMAEMRRLASVEADNGRLMESGYLQFMKVLEGSGIPVPNTAVREILRAAFFAGGNHVFAALDLFLREDTDPEPASEDINRMMSLRQEVDDFIESGFRVRRK